MWYVIFDILLYETVLKYFKMPLLFRLSVNHTYIIRITAKTGSVSGHPVSRAVELGFKNPSLGFKKLQNPQNKSLGFLSVLCNLINKRHIQILFLICKIHQFHRHGILLRSLFR